jgi:sec-independent protein translocase protein TatA
MEPRFAPDLCRDAMPGPIPFPLPFRPLIPTPQSNPASFDTILPGSTMEVAPRRRPAARGSPSYTNPPREPSMIPLFAILGLNPEMLVVLIVVLLLFGNRLPGVMRSLGKGVTEFKKGIEGVEDDVDAAVKKAELKSEPPKTADQQPAKT